MEKQDIICLTTSTDIPILTFMMALERAIAIIGTQKKLADLLRVTKAAVNQWKMPGRRVPASHCPEIERLTHGIVRCEDLRSDLNWELLRKDKKFKTIRTERTRSTDKEERTA